MTSGTMENDKTFNQNFRRRREKELEKKDCKKECAAFFFPFSNLVKNISLQYKFIKYQAEKTNNFR